MAVRVVVDTNSWVSSFVSAKSLVAQRMARLLANERVEVLFSAALRDEILDVIQRPKFSKYLSATGLQGSVLQVAGYGLVPVVSEVSLCRDPKDNFLLALCQDGHADFLITGDQDLLVLERFGSTRILSWAAADTETALQLR